MIIKQAFYTENAPRAIGPYSQAVSNRGLLFVSGQLGVNPDTGKMAGDTVEEQARQALENLKSIAIAANRDLGSTLKTTIFLTDMADFAKVNEVYARFFSEPYPARSTIAVKALPLNAKVEVEAVLAWESL